MIRAFPAVALLALVSCTPPPDGDARIILERAGDDGRWRATYVLDKPADELRFQRQANFYREDAWEIVTPGWRLDRRGDDQVLVAEAEADRHRLVVEFPEYTDHLVKEYEFFRKFTDGSIAVYTGHLYITGEPPPEEGAEDEADFLVRVDLRPRDEEHLVVRGKQARGRTVWDDPDGDGTYVYFGTIEPLETDAMIAVLDPGTPEWLTEELRRLLPGMFEFYTTEFGAPLPWKPVVLFSFTEREGGGLSNSGGTLSGLVQMSAEGSTWHDATPINAEHLLYLIAHEAAHLWNGQLYPYRDSADSWMHEGSADAFAELALMRTGTIDAARLAERRTKALNRCVKGLGDGALHDSGERGQFHNYYSCGNLLAVWSVAVLGDPGDFQRLFDVWRGVFAHADAESRYDRQSYFDALASLGVDAAKVDALRSFLDEGLDDPAAGVSVFLSGAGIRVIQLDRPTPPLRGQWAAAAMQHLMASTCNGWSSFYREWPWIRTATSASCEPFREELRIVTMEGNQVAADGDRAFAAAAARCRAGRPVRLGLDGGGVAIIPCTAEPPEPPAPLAFPVL